METAGSVAGGVSSIPEKTFRVPEGVVRRGSSRIQMDDPRDRMSPRSANCLRRRVTVSREAPIEFAITWCVGRDTEYQPSSPRLPDSCASRSR